MAKRWKVLCAAGALLAVLVVYGLAQEGGPPPEGPRGPMGTPPGQARDPGQMEKLMLSATVVSAANLPEAREAFEKHRQATDADTREFMEALRSHMPALRDARDANDEEAAKKALDEAKKDVLPIAERLTVARLKYCEELLKVAKENPKAVASGFVDELIRRRPGGAPQGRPGMQRQPGGPGDNPRGPIQ